MKTIDHNLISRLEKLSKIQLDADERKKITGDLQSIVSMFDHLESVDTAGISPLRQVSDRVNVYRADEVKNELDRNQALKNVPEALNGFIAVPKFLKTD